MSKFAVFLFRWVANAVGLWLAIALFGTGYEAKPEGVWVFLLVGLIFSLVNTIIKPLVVLLSLPLLLVTLGLFMLIVNGFMVYISIKLTPGIDMTFWHAVLTGIVIGLVNYMVSNLLDVRQINQTNRKGRK